MYKTIQTDSLEIFKHNNYFKTDIGMVSDNAYLSVIATNNCQCNCPYCINSETDRRLDLPLGKVGFHLTDADVFMIQPVIPLLQGHSMVPHKASLAEHLIQVLRPIGTIQLVFVGNHAAKVTKFL